MKRTGTFAGCGIQIRVNVDRRVEGMREGYQRFHVGAVIANETAIDFDIDVPFAQKANPAQRLFQSIFVVTKLAIGLL